MHSFSICTSFTRVVRALKFSLQSSPRRCSPPGIKSNSAVICRFVQSVSFLLSTSLSLSFHLPFVPSISPSMPWVGGLCRRWEVRARVCAGNHGNPVLIGQWPGRMIVSCCQWGLFMQTGSRVGQPQMGPSDMRGRTRRRIYSLHFQFEPWNQFGEKLKLWLEWIAAWSVCLRCVLVWLWPFSACVCLRETLLASVISANFPKRHMFTFKRQSSVAPTEAITLVCREQRRK